MQFRTERLLLREFDEDDFEQVREIDGDPEILRYRSRKVISEAETRSFLQECERQRRALAPTRFSWAIILQGAERLVGQIGLTYLPQTTSEAFLWYSVNRKYWSHGIMSEAMPPVLQFALDRLGLEVIHARCQAENVGSWRVMEKAGLKRIEERAIQDGSGPAYTEYHYLLIKAGLASS